VSVAASRAGAVAFARHGSGPAVLMIQGVGVIGEGWRPQIDDLSNRYTCITFDNRGMGGTPLGGDPLSIDLMAEDALAVADANGIDRFHLVGHSMGGVIAQELALRVTSRVRSLCLMCTVARGRDAAGLTPRMLWLGTRTRIGTRAMRRNAFLEIVMPPAALHSADRGALAARLADLFGHDLADAPPVVMAQIRAMARYDAGPRLAALAGVPTLVLCATHDPIARPASARALAAAIPGARVVEFGDASHGLPIQWADRVNALLREHMSLADQSSP